VDALFIEKHEKEIQEWLVGYKKPGRPWQSFTIPSDVSKSLIEKIINELNQKYEIVYQRKIMGAVEKENNFCPRGGFLGL